MNEVVDDIYEDETAEELYERIQREKERLIKEGKLKKQKKLPEISEDEIPFEIPKSWKWVRLGEVAECLDKLRKPINAKERSKRVGNIPYYGATGKVGHIDDYLTNEQLVLLGEDGAPFFDLIKNKAYIIEGKAWINNHAHILRSIYGEIGNKYLCNYLNVFNYTNYVNGTTRLKLTQVRMNMIPISVPPLSEQKRIVELIDRLFEKLDEAKEKALSALNTFELRKGKILHLAIQGKLSKQLDEYGTAEELYERIQREKERLIKEGKLKKQKKLPEISEDEIPFEIPKSWKWVRLGEIGEIVGGGTPKTNNSEFWINGNIAWITPADMKNVNGKYVSFGERNITEKGLNYSSAKLMPKHSVIYSSRAPIGYVAIADNSLATNQGFKSIVPYEFEMDNFLYYCLIDRTEDITMRATGTTFKEISGSEFGNTIIPLPPLSEQKRISELIDRLFEKLDEVKEKALSALNTFELRKAKILHLAIQGKLSKQLDEYGTAEELYERIQREKERLIKEGKLKKQKKPPEIFEDEIPFEIPKSWKWVRLGELSDTKDNSFADGPFGSNLKKEHYINEPEVRIIQISNISEEGWKNENVKYTSFIHSETIKRSMVSCGDIVITKMMPAGRAIQVPDIEKNYILSSDVIKFVPHSIINRKYLLYSINSSLFKNQIYGEVRGITRVRTSLMKIKSYLIPLPPPEEQEEIVKLLDSIFEKEEKAKKLIESTLDKIELVKKSILARAVRGEL